MKMKIKIFTLILGFSFLALGIIQGIIIGNFNNGMVGISIGFFAGNVIRGIFGEE